MIKKIVNVITILILLLPTVSSQVVHNEMIQKKQLL